MRNPHLSRYLAAGVTALIPLWVTWLVFKFLFGIFSQIGGPPIDWLAWTIKPIFPSVAAVLQSKALQGFLEVLLVGGLLYTVGLATSVMLGKKAISAFEQALDRIPIVKSVYGSVKKLVSVLGESPGPDLQRVVLIEFPNKNMKTVGLVTRSFSDSNTGRKLVAVYVPTTPNPTSGFLEIVPADRIVSTDWTMDEAMSFVISGGTIAPNRLTYDYPNESPGESSYSQSQALRANGYRMT